MRLFSRFIGVRCTLFSSLKLPHPSPCLVSPLPTRPRRVVIPFPVLKNASKGFDSYRMGQQYHGLSRRLADQSYELDVNAGTDVFFGSAALPAFYSALPSTVRLLNADFDVMAEVRTALVRLFYYSVCDKIPCSTIQYSTVQSNTVHCSVVLYEMYSTVVELYGRVSTREKYFHRVFWLCVCV